MSSITHEYYGDQTRWFIGVVIDHTPPVGLEGRVKIRIRGIHDGNVNNIPQRDLPWAMVMLPSDTQGSSGLGKSPQIIPGAQVFGIFLDGKDSQLPMVLGTLPKTEYPSTVQSENRLDPSVNLYAYDFNELEYIAEAEDLSIDHTRIRLALKFFIDNGYTKEQTCGIVGTLYAISKLDPAFIDQVIYKGIAGWNINTRRWIRYQNFAAFKFNDKVPERLDLQLQYVLNELRTTEKTANGRVRFAKTVLDTDYNPVKLCRERRYNGATSNFYYYYLHPSTQQIVDLSSCEKYAVDFYNNLLTKYL